MLKLASKRDFSSEPPTGPDKGSYYNQFFLRGKQFLARRIHRVKIKGTGARKPSSPESEPNFYAFPMLPANSVRQVVWMQVTKAHAQAVRGVTPSPLHLHKSAAAPIVVSPMLTAVASVPPQAIMSVPCQTIRASVAEGSGTLGSWSAVASVANPREGLRRAFEQAVTAQPIGGNRAMRNTPTGHVDMTFVPHTLKPDLVPSRSNRIASLPPKKRSFQDQNLPPRKRPFQEQDLTLMDTSSGDQQKVTGSHYNTLGDSHVTHPRLLNTPSSRQYEVWFDKQQRVPKLSEGTTGHALIQRAMPPSPKLKTLDPVSQTYPQSLTAIISTGAIFQEKVYNQEPVAEVDSATACSRSLSALMVAGTIFRAADVILAQPKLNHVTARSNTTSPRSLSALLAAASAVQERTSLEG